MDASPAVEPCHLVAAWDAAGEVNCLNWGLQIEILNPDESNPKTSRAEVTVARLAVEAMAGVCGEQRRHHTTPLYRSQRRRARKPKPMKSAGAHYTSRTFHRVVQNGDKPVGVSHWHPHPLRRNAATSRRKEFGLDVARVFLGHSSPAVTETYAELDREKAMNVMGLVG